MAKFSGSTTSPTHSIALLLFFHALQAHIHTDTTFNFNICTCILSHFAILQLTKEFSPVPVPESHFFKRLYLSVANAHHTLNQHTLRTLEFLPMLTDGITKRRQEGSQGEWLVLGTGTSAIRAHYKSRLCKL